MIYTKNCTTCKKNLSIDLFYKDRSKSLGVSNQCKECKKSYNRSYSLKNGVNPVGSGNHNNHKGGRPKSITVSVTKKKVKTATRKTIDPDYLRDINRKAYLKRKENDPEYFKRQYLKRKEKDPDFKKKEHKKYYQKNKDTILSKRKERRKNDPVYALGIRIRNLINVSFSKKGKRKKSKAEIILGCTIPEFHRHIESLFVEGMNWDNRSKWDIDHKIPIASANTEEDIIRLNHYTNLRPLWSYDNRSKGARYEH